MLHLLSRDVLMYIVGKYLPTCYYIWILRLVCTSLNKRLKGMEIEEDIKLYLSERREFLIYTGYGMMSERIKEEITLGWDDYNIGRFEMFEYVEIAIWTGLFKRMNRRLDYTSEVFQGISQRDMKRLIHLYMGKLDSLSCKGCKGYERTVNHIHNICDEIDPSNLGRTLRRLVDETKQRATKYNPMHSGWNYHLSILNAKKHLKGRRETKYEVYYNGKIYYIYVECIFQSCTFKAPHIHFYFYDA